ncbi:putative N-acetyltransferase ycf52-like protein, partial [Parachaetomium inaequale]
MIIRLASEADLEAMTAVLVGASPLDPVYPYRFPDRHLYPAEFAALCRRKCAEYLETSTVVVCELPIDVYGAATQVVAFSAWDMPAAAQPPRSRRASAVEPTSPTSPTLPTSPTTIGNLTRQSAFRAALTTHKIALFDARYRPEQGGHVFLKILLTHPSHQRRGAGTALALWGVEQARALGAYTTVFASPMGLSLYRRLGFREVGRFRVQLEGEGEFVEIPALALGPG